MEIYILENEFLFAKFRTLGGELVELFDKKTQTYRLKRGDEYWAFYAPTLFPIVGRSYEDTIRFHNKPYRIEKHGFLRKSYLDLVDQENHKISFQLHSNEQTYQNYPFDFVIFIIYELLGSSLKITYSIQNLDTSEMFYQIGGHPAFNLKAFDNLHLDDHYIQFSHEEVNVRHLINSEGYFTGDTETIPLNNQKLFLKEDFFKNDAIILKNIQSNQICLKNIKNEHGIKIELPTVSNLRFFYLGIWKPLKADFICIEPWAGCADKRFFYGNFQEKEIYHILKPQQREEFIYIIEVF